MYGRSSSRRRNWSLCALTCVSVTACSGQTLNSTSEPPAGTTVAGLPYFLPRGYVPITFKGTPGAQGGAYQLDATVGATAYMGDPGARLFLAYQHSQWADDHFVLSTDQNGLLQTSSSSATDRTGAVAQKVVEILGQLAQAATGLPTGFRMMSKPSAGQPARCTLPPFTRVISYFPDGDDQTVMINENSEQSLRITVSRSTDTTTGSGPANPPPASSLGTIGNKTGEGVVFRRPTVHSYRIVMEPSGAARTSCGFERQESVQFATVPDTSPAGLYWQDMSRASLVKKDVKLTIANGMLTGVDVDSPSEALAAVSLPSDILKQILSIPASLLTFKVQQINAQQGLTDAEAKAIQSQMDLVQKQQAQLQAQAAAAQR